MKRITFSILAMLIAAGCSEKRTLYVYNWSDYIDEELVRQFEDENDCKVVVDSFDDNESMLAKLMAGATGYDIIFPSSYMIPTLIKNNLVAPLDTNLLPNVIANIDCKYKSTFHSDTMVYSVPYAFSATGIAYRKDVFNLTNDSEMSWEILKSPVSQSRVCMLNDMREMIGIGLHMNGYSINTKNRKEVEKGLSYSKELKKYARKLDNTQYRVGLASGEFYIAIGYTSDILQVMEENPDSPIGFFIPKEGSNCCWDEFAITSRADIELAHKFIDFFYVPENAARNMKYICATVPNRGIWNYVGESEMTNALLNVNKATLDKLELIEDVGDSIEIYIDAWDKFISDKELTTK